MLVIYRDFLPVCRQSPVSYRPSHLIPDRESNPRLLRSSTPYHYSTCVLTGGICLKFNRFDIFCQKNSSKNRKFEVGNPHFGGIYGQKKSLNTVSHLSEIFYPRTEGTVRDAGGAKRPSAERVGLRELRRSPLQKGSWGYALINFLLNQCLNCTFSCIFAS